jgi:hypothetical protein
MADAIYSICQYDALHDYLAEEGIKEVDRITWEKVGLRIRECYNQLMGRGWFDNQEYLNAVKNIR